MIDFEDNRLETRNGARDCVIFVADIFEQLNFKVQIYENYYNLKPVTFGGRDISIKIEKINKFLFMNAIKWNVLI